MEYLILLGLLLLIVICEACAQSSANMLLHSGNWIYLLIGGLFYTLVIYFLSKSHKHAPMGVVNAIWSGLSIVTISTVGAVCFDQKIDLDKLGVMGIILLGVGYLTFDTEPTPG